MLLLVHKRKSTHPAGTVTTPGGKIIGKVEPQNRVAAGTGGQRRRFYAANVCWPGQPEVNAYIGTRYVTRAQAVNALRDFHALYGIIRLSNIARMFSAQNTLTTYGGGMRSERTIRQTATFKAAQQWTRERRAAHPFNRYPAPRVAECSCCSGMKHEGRAA